MKVCDDCRKSTYDAVHYGLGAIRCRSCANILSANLAEINMKAAAVYRAILDKIKETHENSETCDYEECQDCCFHDYDPGEGMMCSNCNKEYPY